MIFYKKYNIIYIESERKEREMRKKTFIKHQRFFELLFKYWTHDDVNKKEITIFYKSLWSMFKKVAEFHGINPKIWTAK